MEIRSLSVNYGQNSKMKFDDVLDAKITVQLCDNCKNKLESEYKDLVYSSVPMAGIICSTKGCSGEADHEVVISVNV